MESINDLATTLRDNGAIANNTRKYKLLRVDPVGDKFRAYIASGVIRYSSTSLQLDVLTAIESAVDSMYSAERCELYNNVYKSFANTVSKKDKRNPQPVIKSPVKRTSTPVIIEPTIIEPIIIQIDDEPDEKEPAQVYASGSDPFEIEKSIILRIVTSRNPQ